MFKLTEATGIPGTDNPIVKGIILQFNRILETNMLELDELGIQDIRSTLLECMHDLLELDRLYEAYIATEDEAVRAVVDQGDSIVQGRLLRFQDPTDVLIRQFKAFLMQSYLVTRRVGKVTNKVLRLKQVKPKELRKHLLGILPEGSHHREMLEADSKWIATLCELRGTIEHPEDNPELEISRFDVVGLRDGKPIVCLPILVSENMHVREYMRGIQEIMLPYCEDMIAMLLGLKCSEQVRIVLLPEELRERFDGFRYVLDLKEKYKKGLPGHT